jgi:hypothetical protein
MKVYELCDSKGYKYNVTVYLGRDRKPGTAIMAATHAVMVELTASI